MENNTSEQQTQVQGNVQVANPPVEVEQQPQTQTVTPEPIAGQVPPQPKKGLPVVPLAVAGILIVITILFFVVKGFIDKGSSEEGISLVYWGLWEDSSIINPLIAEYEAKNPGVEIKYVRQSHQDYRERLTNALAKGNGPDIFRFHNSWVPMFRNDLDYLPSSVMSAGEYAQTYYPVAISDLSSGTGIVGIPLGYDAITLFINEDIFIQAGKTSPKTWDELRQVARELTIKDEQGTITQAGVALGRVENVDHWQEILALMMLQNGVDLSNPSGELAEDALTFFSVFSSVDGVWDQTLPPSTTAFAAGKLAMYFAPSWRIFEILQQNPGLNIKAVSTPQLPTADSNEAGISYASYWVEGVWARSEKKTLAWDFLNFISSKESLGKFYKNAAGVRLFGEPYPRVDMANLLVNDPIVGLIVSSAPNAQSWYLYSRTWDGPTGINSLLSKYFEDAINSINAGNLATEATESLAAGVKQVLTQYGLMGQ